MTTIHRHTAGGICPPPLGILQLEMTVNTTDKALLENLNYCKSLNLPEVQLMIENDRTLAIVGSGPSLRDTYGLIPKDADVMALNGAYKFLRSKGVVPTYFAMLDSRDVNLNFFEYLHQDTTYLISSQCHKNVFSALMDYVVGVFHLGTPTTRSVFQDKELYVGGGGTIGMTAMSLALALGYKRVILYGYDSSFKEENLHAIYQPQNSDQEKIEVWVENRKYFTTLAMASQTMDFFPFLQAIRKVDPNFVIDLVGQGLFYDFVVTNNNPTSRERELGKYAEAYMDPDYGMTMQRAKGLTVLLSQLKHNSTYLDVSTGRGEALNIGKQFGFKVKGTETVEALCGPDVVKAVLPDLPFADKSFDVVSLIEVIEHLLPDDVIPALNELTRLAKNHILVSAAVTEHWFGGVNLHPSAKPVEEWDKLFHTIWGEKAYRVGSLGQSPVWRVDL